MPLGFFSCQGRQNAMLAGVHSVDDLSRPNEVPSGRIRSRSAAKDLVLYLPPLHRSFTTYFSCGPSPIHWTSAPGRSHVGTQETIHM